MDLSSKIQLEWRAQNKVGTKLDVDGSSWGGTSLFPDGPSELTGNLWAATTRYQTDPHIEINFDAGDYLCNFAYYLARIRHPLLPSGFVHVPPFDVLPKEVQLASLLALIDDLERAEASG